VAHAITSALSVHPVKPLSVSIISLNASPAAPIWLILAIAHSIDSLLIRLSHV
jgi:hypothetical protein